MKMMLLSLTLCAVINTSVAQVAALPNKRFNAKAVNLMDEEKTIAANISGCNFSTIFYKALKLCDLVETFNNQGPLTVFLPADSVFDKLPKSRIDSLLLPQNKYNLISLLTYHALPGKLSIKDITKYIRRGKGKTTLHTVAGAWLTAQLDASGNIILTDEKGGKCALVNSNLKQQNGVIHLVSAVLVPQFEPI